MMNLKIQIELKNEILQAVIWDWKIIVHLQMRSYLT